MHRLRRRASDDRGNAAVEGCIYLLGLFILISLIIVGGRLALTHQALDHVAFQSARTASLQRDAGSAQAAAVAQASATLQAQKISCITSSTNVDTSGFSAPLGQTASVSATTRCRVDLSGLVAVFPGSVEVTATAESPIDSFRAR